MTFFTKILNLFLNHFDKNKPVRILLKAFLFVFNY